MKRYLFIFCFIMAFDVDVVQAEEYSLVVQPMLSPAKVKRVYRPLAKYLSEKTGHTIKVATYGNFEAYWKYMRESSDFDMVLDAAHFTDYRLKNKNYRVLAKIPDTVSFSLVTGKDLLVLDVEELAAQKIASMMVPSLGGIRIQEIFASAGGVQPTVIRAKDADDAIAKLQNGEAQAAMVPTSLLQNYSDLNTVITTTPVPHMGFSVSPKIPNKLSREIKKALLNAKQSEAGRKMLKIVGIETFVAASASTYDGYAKLLQ